jgi:hypothetical protein
MRKKERKHSCQVRRKDSMLRINASEVAACIGENKFSAPAEMAEKIWKRMDLYGYLSAAERNKITQKPDITIEIDELAMKEKVDHVIHSEHSTYRKELDNILIDLDERTSPDVANGIRSFIFTERGKDAEEEMLERLEKILDKKITKRNDKFYKKYFDYGDGKRFLVGGKVDGITEDNILVEVKNRQYRLFPEIPIYEKIQVHVYMFLTGISECHVVQFHGEDESRFLVNFQEEFWTDISERLTSFVETVRKILDKKELQDEFLNGSIYLFGEEPTDS